MLLFQCGSVHIQITVLLMVAYTVAPLQNCSHVAPIVYPRCNFFLQLHNNVLQQAIFCGNTQEHTPLEKKKKLLSMMERTMRSRDETVKYLCACKHTD